MKREGLHLHFGAGAIGFTCAFDLLWGRNGPIVMVQRHPKRYGLMSQIRERHGLPIQVHIETQGASTELRAPDQLWVVDGRATDSLEQLQKLCSKQRPVLLFAEQNTLAPYNTVLQHVSSLSAAVKDESNQYDVINASDAIPFATPRPPLFLLENDHYPKSAKNVSVQRVVVDRICSMNTQKSSANTLVFLTEPFSEFIALTSFPGQPQTWWEAKTDDQFHFFVLRKRYLVNSAHSAIVVAAFDYLHKKGYSVHDWSVQLLPVLIDAMAASKFDQAVDTFLQVQAIRLVLETSDQTREELFPGLGQEQIYGRLVAYATRVKDRMRRMPDGVARVFGIPESADAAAVLTSASRKLTKHLDPFTTAVAKHRNAIRDFPAIGTPRPTDVEYLDSYLMARMAELTKEAIAARRKPREVPIDPSKQSYSVKDVESLLEKAGLKIALIPWKPSPEPKQLSV